MNVKIGKNPWHSKALDISANFAPYPNIEITFSSDYFKRKLKIVAHTQSTFLKFPPQASLSGRTKTKAKKKF